MSALMIWVHGIPMTLPEINYFPAQQQDICKMVCLCIFKAVTLSAFVSPETELSHCMPLPAAVRRALQTWNQYLRIPFWWTHTGDRQIPLVKKPLDRAQLRLLIWLMDWYRQLCWKLQCDWMWQSLADGEQFCTIVSNS